MTSSTRDLLVALARILRAAAEEADAIAAESSPALREGEIRTTGKAVSSLVQRRALAAMRRQGISVDPCDHEPDR